MKKIFLSFVLFFVSICMATSYYVASNGTGTSSQGTSWAQAWNYDTLKLVKANGTIVAGDNVFIKSGTYTPSEATYDTMKSVGTSVAPITLIGVLSGTTNAPPVGSDWVTLGDTANMPHFAYGTHRCDYGAYTQLYNLYYYGDTARGVQFVGTNGYNYCENCAFVNNHTSTTTTAYCSYYSTNMTLENCYFRSSFGKGITASGTIWVYDCVFDHFIDATNGIAAAPTNTWTIENSVFIKCGVAAISLGASTGLHLTNCTFDSNAVSVSATTGAACFFKNNIHRSATTNCYAWTTQEDVNIFKNTHIGLNTKHVAFAMVDTLSVHQDYGLTSGDPLVTTPGINYSLRAGSPCLNKGYTIKLGVK
jgi:hypothetical protein